MSYNKRDISFLLWGTPFTDSSSETVAHADVSFAEHLLSTLGRGVARMQAADSSSLGLPHEMCITYNLGSCQS